MNKVKNLYDVLVVGNQKAIMGFVLAAGAVLVAKVGWSLDMTLRQALEACANGAVVALGVWLKANK